MHPEIVAFPPPGEQREIADAIDGLIANISVKVALCQREIDLLREYRTRLVAEVVTGKIDVREAAARLPDAAPLEAVEDHAGLTGEADTPDEEAAA